MRNRSAKESQYLSDADVQLMLNVKQGHRHAFEVLIRKYYPRILNFIYRFLGNRQIAEDLTQEVFLKVYKSAARYKPRSRFQTWLFTVAKNTSLNELRRKKDLILSLDGTFHSDGNELRDAIADQNTTPDQAIIEKEKLSLIRKAVNDLPEKQRIAVILRRYENFSYAEIAATLDVSDQAVKSLLSRAKKNLKNSLAKLIDMD